MKRQDWGGGDVDVVRDGHGAGDGQGCWAGQFDPRKGREAGAKAGARNHSGGPCHHTRKHAFHRTCDDAINNSCSTLDDARNGAHDDANSAAASPRSSKETLTGLGTGRSESTDGIRRFYGRIILRKICGGGHGSKPPALPTWHLKTLPLPSARPRPLLSSYTPLPTPTTH